MTTAVNPALTNLCSGVHSFVTEDMGVGVIPMGADGGVVEFGAMDDGCESDLESLSRMGGALSPYALSLPVDPKELGPGRLSPHLRSFIEIFDAAKQKIDGVAPGKRRDERLSVLAHKELERGNSLGRDGRDFMAASAFLTSGIYLMGTEGHEFDAEMGRTFKRAANNFSASGALVLSALSWELSAVSEPARMEEFGKHASRLWFDILKHVDVPEERYLAIGQGLQFAWRASSWKYVQKFLEALADFELDRDLLENAAHDRLRAAWLGSLLADAGYIAQQLEEAVFIMEVAEAEEGVVSKAQGLMEAALGV